MRGGPRRGRRDQPREAPETSREELAAASGATRIAAQLADQVLVAVGAETAWHSQEVERLALRMCDRLGLSGREREIVGVAARLHDIGKVGIPRTLLEKPGPLTTEEWEQIYTHTIVGEQILQSVHELRPVARLVRHSHERWDGTGYPDGLQGEQIPRASRIVFCADAFHSICSDRPYRRGRSVAAALTEIRRCAGTQFEPGVVEALTDVVRKRLYGSQRIRRRSHGSVSLLVVCALMLGGSIAGGIAASSDAPRGSGQESASPASGALAPIGGGIQLGSQATTSGSVAGGLAHADGNGPAGLDHWLTGAVPQDSPQSTPNTPGKPPRSTAVGTRIGPPIEATSILSPSANPAPGVGDRSGIPVSLPTGDGTTTDDGGKPASDQAGPDLLPATGNDQLPGLPD